MAEEKLMRRFGSMAIEKGFITKDQFIEAMAMQIETETEGIKPKNIGSILNAMGYITEEQINEVLEAIYSTSR